MPRIADGGVGSAAASARLAQAAARFTAQHAGATPVTSAPTVLSRWRNAQHVHLPFVRCLEACTVQTLQVYLHALPACSATRPRRSAQCWRLVANKVANVEASR
jgi:hypothetical protein